MRTKCDITFAINGLSIKGEMEAQGNEQVEEYEEDSPTPKDMKELNLMAKKLQIMRPHDNVTYYVEKYPKLFCVPYFILEDSQQLNMDQIKQYISYKLQYSVIDNNYIDRLRKGDMKIWWAEYTENFEPQARHILDAQMPTDDDGFVNFDTGLPYLGRKHHAYYLVADPKYWQPKIIYMINTGSMASFKLINGFDGLSILNNNVVNMLNTEASFACDEIIAYIQSHRD